jgi:menaquinone-dependent protoporphyrinogen oxidase
MTAARQPATLRADDVVATLHGGPTGRPLRRVLVAVASRHGATRDIARAIGARLEQGTPGREDGVDDGVMAVVLPVEQRPDPRPYDAVILGSAVYMGRWLEPARDYATAFAGALRERPVWLFSSGPIGAPPFPPDEPHDAGPLRQITGAREHCVFPGRLDKQVLGFGERAMVTAMRAPTGDFRDWDGVRAWADAIAVDLAATWAVAR